MTRGLTSKLIELYVQERGPVTIDNISNDLDLPKLTVCAVLPQLTDAGRVDRAGESVCARKD